MSSSLTRRAVLSALPAAGVMASGAAWAQNRDLRLDADIGGESIRLIGDRRFAGAISSIQFRGVEHVDRNDHGRLFQGAVQFGGLGECHNPTQAGASRDRSRSTSRLLEAEVGDGVWRTVTQAAYWHRPNDTCATPAGVRRRPANRTRVSRTLYEWTHRFGRLAHPNAVAVDVAVRPDPGETDVVAEALTIYAPPRLATVHRVAGRRLLLDEAVIGSPGERPEPRILSTVDGRHGLALLSLDETPAGYGRWLFGSASKLNLVFRPRPGDALGWRCAWAIGSRDEVADAIRRLI